MSSVSRRGFLVTSAAAGVGSALAGAPVQAAKRGRERKYQQGASPWPICLDTATIRPSSLEEKVRIAAAAGYDAIEPWDGELAEYEKNGGNLEDLGKKIRDLGLFVPSVIGLWNGITPTQEAWERQLPETRNRLRMVSAIGAEHVQVIPSREVMDEKWMADKYRELLEIGLNEYNVNPALVFVVFLPSSKRMGQASAVAIDANHPKAKIIPDVFHMHIGDTGFEGLKHIAGDFIAIFQFNDAPAAPVKEKLEDKHRVYPGDGILPLEQCLRDIHANGFKGCISLELYNEEYWKQDHLEVAKIGLEKTLGVIDRALG
jgi:sugar phosphate isomerase/epimerase